MKRIGGFIMDELEKSLIDFIEKKNNENGNTDVKVSNIRFWNNGDLQNAFADVSFTWYLNAWAKPTKLIDVVFLFRNGEWITSTIF
jgi:hypothetical protein